MLELQLAEDVVVCEEEERVHHIDEDHDKDAEQMVLEEASNEMNLLIMPRTQRHEIKYCNWNGDVHLNVCAHNPASRVVVAEDSRTIQEVVHDGVEDHEPVPQVEY